MVGCGLERGSNDTRERRVVSERLRAKTVLALFPPFSHTSSPPLLYPASNSPARQIYY